MGSSLFSSGFSLDNLVSGGGISDLISFSSNSESTPKTKLNLQQPQKKEPDLNIATTVPSSQKIELILESSSTPIDLTNLSIDKGKGEMTNSIQRVYSAMEVEGKVKKIDKETQDKYSFFLSKTLSSDETRQKEHLKNFEKAREQLKSKAKGKRSTLTDNTLSQKQRIAIEKMYHLHNSLKEESKKIESSFQKEVQSDSIITSSSQEQGISVKDVKNALKIIQWTSKSLRTQKDMSDLRFFKADSWGAWKDNPFKHFYSNEGEFKKDISSLQTNAMKVYRIKQSLEREWRPMINRFRDQKMREILEKQYQAREREMFSLDASKDSHIVQKVANYLLGSMGQL